MYVYLYVSGGSSIRIYDKYMRDKQLTVRHSLCEPNEPLERFEYVRTSQRTSQTEQGEQPNKTPQTMITFEVR